MCKTVIFDLNILAHVRSLFTCIIIFSTTKDQHDEINVCFNTDFEVLSSSSGITVAQYLRPYRSWRKRKLTRTVRQGFSQTVAIVNRVEVNILSFARHFNDFRAGKLYH